MRIEMKEIVKRYDKQNVVDDIFLTIEEGELVALLGPSGSGKTTLLRMIAGLEIPDNGEVYFNDEDVTTKDVREREIGFVFQHYALFKHMTVFDNIAFGMRVQDKKVRKTEKEITEKVEELLALIRLENLKNRYPSQLSGGQRQRVALARALAINPKVLLLDEPFGALDAKVRKELRRWLKRVQKEIGMTTIFVTHDQEEALDLADKVVILNQGKIEQIGTPTEVYEHPETPFVFSFLGNVNLFHGRIHEGKLIIGDVQIPVEESRNIDEAVGYVRPHEIALFLDNDCEDCIPVEISHYQPYLGLIRLELENKETGVFLEAEVTREQFRELNLEIGMEIYVKPSECRVFMPEDFSI